jgi:hypothetical protein
MLLLLAAGILAFPASFERRAQGFAVGLTFVYLLTVARLMSLHFTLRYCPAAWDILHGLILPLGPVLLVALYFLRWSGASESLPAGGRRHAA